MYAVATCFKDIWARPTVRPVAKPSFFLFGCFSSSTSRTGKKHVTLLAPARKLKPLAARSRKLVLGSAWEVRARFQGVVARLFPSVTRCTEPLVKTPRRSHGRGCARTERANGNPLTASGPNPSHPNYRATGGLFKLELPLVPPVYPSLPPASSVAGKREATLLRRVEKPACSPHSL